MTSIPLPKIASDAQHVTDALRRSGVLANGRVCAVAVESSRPTVLSHIVRLRLSYDGAAAGAPDTVILKTGLPDRAPTWNAGRREVAFYQQVASAMAGRTVPRCYEAAWEQATNAWHLLLEDLTQSHAIATVWPLPPSTVQCESVVTAWARFHAAWWDDPRLGNTVGEWTGDEAAAADLKRFAERYAQFADQLADRLPPERRTLYERLLVAAPRLYARIRARRNLTIVHGDSHVWNCFLPRDASSGDVRLFDWDSWRIDTATDDLAYMMAMHWYPDRRRRLERPLLDRYHATLEAHGVRGYDRRELDEDYRLSVLWLLARPVWQAASNIPPVIWWNNLERTLLAIDDLGCAGLLA
jgi:hypothetical protein